MIVNKNAGHVPLEIPENSQPLTGIRPGKTTKNRDNDESQPKSGNDILDKLEDLVNY